jgi:flagellar assembly protein FliH
MESAMGIVIKTGEQNPKLLKRLETLDVTDHLGEAKLVAEASKRESLALLQKAATDADEIRREAEDKGYEAGFRRGYDAGRKAGQDAAFEQCVKTFAENQEKLASALRAMLADIEQRKRDLFIAARNDVVRFAAKVAGRVTRRVATLDSGAATANLEAALALVESKTDLRVRIHPQDVATMRAFAGDLKERFEEVRHIDLIEDDALAPGGCIVSTPDTEVDASIDTQVQQIAELLVGREGSQ